VCSFSVLRALTRDGAQGRDMIAGSGVEGNPAAALRRSAAPAGAEAAGFLVWGAACLSFVARLLRRRKKGDAEAKKGTRSLY